jgi:isoleucyl-tRNA synthetase
MFDPVDPKQSFPELERGILKYWQHEDAFKRSVRLRSHGTGDLLDGPAREDEQNFSFYDGPPFATGLPHYGHLLAGTIKDVIPRYQTMRGKRVERRFGWDCHGLPVEYEIEKEHGIQNRKQIEEMGVKAFNDLCRAAVQRYTKEWRVTVERMGRWVDMDWDYRTMDPDYMESIWWVFRELHTRGLLYEGWKPMHICPRCETPLSNFEVTQGYKDITDHSVTARFELVDEPGTFVLAWTTTPWTLPGNLFLAVGKDVTYVTVESEGARYIVAKDRIEVVFKGREYKVLDEFSGKKLLGKRYAPLFPYFEANYKDKAFRVVDGSEFVATNEGTGIVHIATGFGEDDFLVGQREGVGVLQHVRMDGRFTDDVKDFANEPVKPINDPSRTDRKVAKWLKDHGKLFDEASYTHSYPHCWRCETPLLNYATASWFVAVEEIKKDMLAANKKTAWVPSHIRDGRFGKWLEGARDWAISRNRYWGTPLPIWRNRESGELHVIGSRDELTAMQPERFTKVTLLRHGESEGNIVPKYQGVMPGTDLSKRGKKQADELAAALKKAGVSVIYHSPLHRTKQTAEALAKATGAQLREDDRIREVNFGEWEGKTVDFGNIGFVAERRADKLEKKKIESIYHLDGMETWEEVQKRTSSFLREILPKHRGEHIAIVTHADPLLTIRHFFTKEDPLKLTHQPYPRFTKPYVHFWDHETDAELDLHKETVDEIALTDQNGRRFERVPDVLDCWFESGSMPYAQLHFPFEFGQGTTPPGFPADFIAEGIDQTRGWFYTLMVLSTALFKQPAFMHCIVNGTVLAEDGKKMSKRLKNYPEPLEVVERHGADAVRFALMSSPAVRAEDLRFSERYVEETVRAVMLPLWNTYSFFVTYANAAKWEPAESRRRSPHPLDEWIRAEVQDLVNRMTTQLDQYDLSATCWELHDTIDALTNWYVRLSRRRFAGKSAIHTRDKAGEDDQADALSTLYDVLLTISQLLAPFAPFITEAMYVNLVPEEHGSIHFTDWPLPRALTKQETALLEKTRLLRLIVSLGQRVRSEQKVKLRQPLAKATIAVPRSLMKHGAFVQADLALLQEELNVKQIEVIDDPGELATAIAQVDARKVGPRLGAAVQELIQAGKRGEFTQREDGAIDIKGEVLTADEASVVYRGREGENVASDHGVVVSLMTDITAELTREGKVREIIHSIQMLRKSNNYSVADKVRVHIHGADDILKSHGDMIMQETNSVFTDAEDAQLSVTIAP